MFDDIKQKSGFFSLSEIMLFSCYRIVSRYVNRVEYYRYVILMISDAVLSSQG